MQLLFKVWIEIVFFMRSYQFEKTGTFTFHWNQTFRRIKRKPNNKPLHLEKARTSPGKSMHIHKRSGAPGKIPGSPFFGQQWKPMG